jgi:branched-subunit amino acid aminotransferase/4-amino-4-deoxychorismate lyase
MPQSLFITATAYRPPPPELYSDGVRMIVSTIRRNRSSPLSSLKTSNYLDSLIAKQEALDRGAFDALMLNSDGQVAEATSSNLFAVKDGTVLTPEAGSGLLAGITREAVMELCSESGLRLREVTLGPEGVGDADEVFITNSMVEILPVGELEGSRIPNCPGPVTRRLISGYRRLVEEETGSAPP